MPGICCCFSCCTKSTNNGVEGKKKILFGRKKCIHGPIPVVHVEPASSEGDFEEVTLPYLLPIKPGPLQASTPICTPKPLVWEKCKNYKAKVDYEAEETEGGEQTSSSEKSQSTQIHPSND